MRKLTRRDAVLGISAPALIWRAENRLARRSIVAGQTLLDYVEERVERREGHVIWIGHDWIPGCGLVRGHNNAHGVSSIFLPPSAR
jgi:hypothetical protein